MRDFARALHALDIGIFSQIPSQTSDDDKRSLLACQLAVRDLVGTYRYIEIGSHLGGSLVPHVLDDSCLSIVSIDTRPSSQPDERGVDFAYHDNSSERMLGCLRAVSSDLSKITTIDSDAADIDASSLGHPAQLCFIDGEHTDRAARSDFEFCLAALAGSGAIVFHDAAIVYNAIAQCLGLLDRRGIDYHAYALPSVVFVVEIGGFALHRSPAIAAMLVDNHVAYLGSLQANDHYRRFATRPAFRAYRRARSLIRRSR